MQRLRCLSKAWRAWNVRTVMLADHQRASTQQLHDTFKYVARMAQVQRQRRVRGAWQVWMLRDAEMVHTEEMHALVRRQHAIALTALERLLLHIHRQFLRRAWVTWCGRTQRSRQAESAQAQRISRCARALNRIVCAARRRGLRQCILRWRLVRHGSDNEALAAVRSVRGICLYVRASVRACAFVFAMVQWHLRRSLMYL